MKRIKRTTGVVAFLALALILVGCNTPTAVVAPTQDIPTIRTESVSTAIAKITIEAALNPTATTQATATQAAATETTAPTATEALAATVTPVPTFTPAATSQSSTSGGSTTSGTGGVVYPTATRRSGPDQTQLISQSPSDGTVFHPGEEFDGAFTFKNIGTSTWNTQYFIRQVKGKGTNISKKDLFPLTGTVKPGETVKAFADLVAPSSAGRYVSYWELCNDNDEVFYSFYLVIDVK